MNGSSRHAIDDTGCFILSDGIRPGAPKSEETFRTVGSHACEQETNCVVARCLGYRGKHDIYGGALKADLRSFAEFDHVVCTQTPEDKVKVSGCYECDASLEAVRKGPLPRAALDLLATLRQGFSGEPR